MPPIETRSYSTSFSASAGTQLYAYSSDVGGRLVTFSDDGSSHELTTALDDGHCLDLDSRVDLDDEQRGLLPPPCS